MDLDSFDVLGSQFVNDTSPNATYQGAGWGYSPNRGYGDYLNDVHATAVDGDYVLYTFIGTGVDVITETSTDRGVMDVQVDGTNRGRIFSTYTTALFVDGGGRIQPHLLSCDRCGWVTRRIPGRGLSASLQKLS